MNPPPTTEIGSQLITLLAALMLVMQLLLVVQPMLLTNIRLFALQSLMLAAIAAVVAYSYNATHVYVVAVLTLVGKVIFLPWLLNRHGAPHQHRAGNRAAVQRARLDAHLRRPDVAGLPGGAAVHVAANGSATTRWPSPSRCCSPAFSS